MLLLLANKEMDRPSKTQGRSTANDKERHVPKPLTDVRSYDYWLTIYYASQLFKI